MKRILAAIFCVMVGGRAMGADAFTPGEIWPDDRGVHINAHGGGMLFDGGVYYWFGEHKIEGTAGNKAHVGVHVYSSPDLYHWTDRGIALAVSADPGAEIADGCVIERPKVLRNPRTGKYVMWFHLELLHQGYRAARAGVAVADSVTGPYRYVGSLRPCAGFWPMNVGEDQKKELTAAEAAAIAKIKFRGSPTADYPKEIVFRRDFKGGQMLRDMTLFADSDGAAYVVYASEENGTIQIAQLSDDYLTTNGKFIRLLSGGFNEAPTMFKREGKYYLITSGTRGWAPADARLAEADGIWGPWTAMGNPCVGPADRTDITFESQGTFVLPVAGKTDAFIFMADRWRPKNAIDGRYVWLPIEFREGKPAIEWRDRWDLGVFDETGTRP
jgi:hypothetical protein